MVFVIPELISLYKDFIKITSIFKLFVFIFF